MNSFIKISTLFFFSLISTACYLSNKNNSSVNSESQSIKYNLSYNGCSTGNQEFSSIEDMCNGLKNDSRNNYCAQKLRYEKFKSECPGHTW